MKLVSTEKLIEINRLIADLVRAREIIWNMLSHISVQSNRSAIQQTLDIMDETLDDYDTFTRLLRKELNINE